MAEDVSTPSRSPADPVELARALVATPSVNPTLDPEGSGEGAVAELVGGWLEDWAFDVEKVEFESGRPSILARLDRGPGRSLVLSGHLDTVGVADMTIDPFDPIIRDGRLLGRGSADMKGGVAAALAAARDLSSEEFTGTLILALTADEEEAGRGCRRLVDGGLRADGAIVCEPTELAIMPAHKGFAWIQIDFHGQAAHGSRPDRGVDAIRHAGLFLTRLEELEASLGQRKRHRLLGSGSIHAGTVRGGTAPSVYPAHCCLTLERRTLPGESVAAIKSEVAFLLAQLRSDVPTLDADLEITLHRNGSEVDEDHELVGALAAGLDAAGLDRRVEGMTAWVEASIYNASGTPAICFGPGSIEEAHTADESTPVEEIRAAHAALTATARSFLV